MPKKTRSQKIIAELRRELASRQARKMSATPRQKKKERAELKKKKPIEKSTSVSTKFENAPRNEKTLCSFILSDLKKSLFLTMLAISLEFVLYYLLEIKSR